MSVRVLILERPEPGPSPETKPTGIVAEAIVFSDGTAVLRWLTRPGAIEVYASEQDMRKIREFSGRSRFRQPGPEIQTWGTEPSPAVTPPDGTGLVIHFRDDFPQPPQRIAGWLNWYQRHGFTIAEYPDDPQHAHPYGRACAWCSADDAEILDCDHGWPGLTYVVNGLCRRCGEDVYRGLGSMAAMRQELHDRGGRVPGPSASLKMLATALDLSNPVPHPGRLS